MHSHNLPTKKKKTKKTKKTKHQRLLPEIMSTATAELKVKEIPLIVKKLSNYATLPKRGSPQAAGFDLSAAYDLLVPAGGKAIAKTDLAMKIPQTCYGRIAPRSGLAWKKHIDVGAGVIDADYRGNVGVVLFNHAKEDLVIKRGDRVAQLVLEKISMAPVIEVTDLDATERGAGGFGSTGV